MTDKQEATFRKFLTERKKKLEMIGRHTQGEYELLDVQSEAWLMMHYIRDTKGIEIDISNRQHQDLLLSYLYQHLVRYTEQTVRLAERLDHWNGNTDEEFSSHPLLRKLAADPRSDPLIEQLERDSISHEPQEPLSHQSLAAAYVYLLRRFDNKMRAVADYLLISISYCYKRYAVALHMAHNQHPIPDARIDDNGFSLKAWRSFRIWTEPLQLSLDFGDELALFDDSHFRTSEFRVMT